MNGRSDPRQLSLDHSRQRWLADGLSSHGEGAIGSSGFEVVLLLANPRDEGRYSDFLAVSFEPPYWVQPQVGL
jgi:hypothetical protein